MDISNLSVAELKALLAKIPKEIERREREEKAAFRKEMEALAAERGFSLDELIGATDTKARSAVAIKYRHPSQPELTWTGRGRQPKWLAELIQNGSNLDQLRA